MSDDNLSKHAQLMEETQPILDDDWFAEADVYIGPRLIRRGRPKRAVSLRLDQEVIDHFKKDGPGWQSRVNEALRRAAAL